MTVHRLHRDATVGNERHQAQHYIGFSENGHTLSARIDHHRKGTSGASIMHALKERGIGFVLARTFKGASRSFERRLKKTKKVRVYCPICSQKPRAYKPKGDIE